MKATHYYLGVFFFLLANGVTAKAQTTYPATLEEVTVFFTGAELMHTATPRLQQGENEIVVSNLSSNVDVNSIKVKTGNGVMVSAFEYSVNHLAMKTEDSEQVRILRDSLDIYTQALEQLNIEQTINSTLLQQLKDGIGKNVSGSEKGLGIDELMKTMEYFDTKSRELEKERVRLSRENKRLTEGRSRVESQLRQESVKNDKEIGELRLHLRALRAGQTSVFVSYFTTAAGWEPTYEIYVEDADAPIRIHSRAKVSQTTGFDWNQVKPTLSSARPGAGRRVAPLFSAWYLQPQQPGIRVRGSSPREVVQNSYSYNQMERTLTPANETSPLYIIDGVPFSAEDFQHISPDRIKSMEVLKDASSTAVYGARAANGVIVIELKNSVEDYVVTEEQSLDMSYAIDLNYNIPGNGKVQYIELRTDEVQAKYKYYATPKLDSQTYLLAEISDWHKLNLLSGNANITYNGTYLGETFLDTSSTGQKLTLTLGSDPRVAVKREKLQDYSSTRLVGNDVTQQFTYQITVRNNRNRPVKMVVKDQYPRSTQKNIDVTLVRKETTPWSAQNEDVGVLSWEDEFAPGEVKTYRLSYSVKYPKGLNLNL
ncbi:MAG: DUF4139 domain-containing protein [Bacteroides sp.]|nr:DUF4139 domain-containing protein [Bacteroides sp.]